MIYFPKKQTKRPLTTTRFPRTWRNGTQKEMEIMAAERAARERYLQENGAERGENAEGERDGTAPKQPPKAFVYSPPAYTSY